MVSVAPSDGLIRYSGYVHLNVDGQRARFDRQYGTTSLAGFGPAAQQNGGARISWRTAAHHVDVWVAYTEPCAEDCSVNLDHSTCYNQQGCNGCHGRCRNECQLSLLLDGGQVEVPAFRRADGRYSGSRLRFELPRPPDAGAGAREPGVQA